ncbi:hypothetical protein KP509_24G066900 [Ceratopteris richardii]|uniref:Uncharacterized protein n=1 Tax=Ceratopteris richardii TaxID=49495 RepID=A0A8T2RXD2_CERRI|nr:hypothetical protein KP509_24G066900 [Ceratopteris richardii]
MPNWKHHSDILLVLPSSTIQGGGKPKDVIIANLAFIKQKRRNGDSSARTEKKLREETKHKSLGGGKKVSCCTSNRIDVHLEATKRIHSCKKKKLVAPDHTGNARDLEWSNFFLANLIFLDLLEGRHGGLCVIVL